MIDPRDEPRADPNEVLTEDSDDALADLEKEFEAKKLKLLEERARKRQRTTKKVEVERSPSPPPRGAREIRESAIGTNSREILKGNPSTTLSYTGQHEIPDFKAQGFPDNRAKDITRGIKKVSRPATEKSSLFASQLFDSKSSTASVNYNERVFEFENLPKTKIEQTSEDTERDLISGEALSRRYYGAPVLDKLLANIKILRVPKLLAKVVPPKYEEPSYVNWCMTGIIMHKSEPKTSVNNKKYMALRVGNFHQTVDVMLFGDAFQKFWKVRAGDVIAILNPTVKKFGNSFSLSILDDLDNLIELGTLKHYGRCAAKTAQGEPCKHIVDTLKNKLCSYHEESKYKQGGRMELQGSVKPKAPQNKRGDASEMYVNGSTKQPMFVQYANAGFHEKDLVFSGGEQFDHTKYDRAVESKASKLRKERANARLEEQLLHNVAPRHLNELTKLGIVNDKRDFAKERQSALRIRKHAFNSTFITGMGFDPTVATNVSGAKSATKLEQLKELRELSQGKKISLEPSVEDKKQKQHKWKQTLKLTKLPIQPIKPTQLKSPNRSIPVVTLLDDEDSDIEITFTGNLEKMQYLHARSGST